MKNDFTENEIKQSVEYQWRNNQIKILLGIWLFISIAIFIVPLLGMIMELEIIGVTLLIWLFFVIMFGVILGGFSLSYYFKNKYFVKNYMNFSCHEVVLDKVVTSLMSRGSIYYKVTIIDENAKKEIDTNPYFSNYLFSKFLPEDYNNKKVVGLYDKNENKFYIIKKVN
ncbi:MAG: hypothetical protein HPY96_05815 [Bacilli bacterium]|jgi:hypothetical protein|nr:hypothetical protein [Bacilli bacterium]